MSCYQPTQQSLDSHEVPEWFRDAKLGIFIHWGIYSVPAWAPSKADIAAEKSSPYAEWYPYYMYREGSPTQKYHKQRHGEDVEYIDFVEDFTAESWDPQEWATLFEDIGAGYVVLTGEHHDGFPLWGSHYTRYNAEEVGPKRDLVGDLCEAVRERGLKFATSYHANLNYYQPGFEGAFGHPDYHGGEPFEDVRPGAEYVDFMNAKHRELIRRYEPDLLWFDTPQADAEHLRSRELIADYYNRAEEWGKEVAVNDRASTDDDALAGNNPSEGVRSGGDFVTPEYTSFDEIQNQAWEACRGIGHSFGYNRSEDDEDHLSPEQIVRLFVDIVSKNGNLLINVGPKADGTIPKIQKDRLRALGEWISTNRDAVLGSRPWVVAEDEASDADVRYTWRNGDLFAIAFEWPGDRVSLSVPKHVDAERPPKASLVTTDGEIETNASIEDGMLSVSLPEKPEHGYAYAVRLSDVANPRQE